MKHFRIGQRVIVRRCEHAPFLGGVAGVVFRPRRADDGAWIRLDERSPAPDAHPFPEDDHAGRGRDVLCWPEDCEPEAVEDK